MADPVSAAALRLAQIRERLKNDKCLTRVYREDVASLLAALARAEQTIREQQAYMQHQHGCPKVFTTKRWVGITHNEQHLDDDPGDEGMKTCGSAVCRAWAKSDDPDCTCGLDAIASLARPATGAPERENV